jgi:hypothetical protein
MLDEAAKRQIYPPRLAHPVNASAVWLFPRCEGIAVNASDQSQSASESAATHIHLEMQRALWRLGLSTVTRDSHARAERWLESWVDAPLDQVAVPQLKDHLSILIKSYSWSIIKVGRYGL